MSNFSPSNTRSPPVRVSGILARSVLTRSVLGERKFGFRYSLNPYRGCPHGCLYCYASSVTRDDRPWGEVVDVKENAPEVLARELRRSPRGLTLVSSATDPYPPQEARARVTRRCLALLREQGFPVSVLTRSPLVVRDLDLLNGWEGADVGFSFTSSRDQVELEPRVPPVARRLEALREISSRGVPTWASIAPVLPSTLEPDLRELTRAVSEAGARNIFVDPLLLAPYPDAARRMAASGRVRGFEPGESERLLRAVEEEGARLGVPVSRRFLGWRPEASSPSRPRAAEPGGP